MVSSAPQIRYPDCYGIDMSLLQDFCVFQAALALLKDTGKEEILKEVYDLCVSDKENIDQVNHVKKVYDPFTDDQLSKKVAEILRPEDLNADLEIIFQSIEELHEACPDHRGDWYFSGNYPTPGGNRVVNKAYMNFFEGKRERAY